MSEAVNKSGGTGPSHRGVEIGVSLATGLLALIGIHGALAVGIGWGVEGPRGGFFPFYVSLIVLISSLVNLVSALKLPGGKLFARWDQLRQVFSVVVPTAVYVFVIPYLGIYVCSTLLIAVFMRWFGRYNWLFVIVVPIAVMALTFFMFEIWFLVPLPKGPLEHSLGY
ncbi:MAG TPA: tripartite tricarboxylate transporter TctB family protein [Xanthobacteraceae bacterium]|nr:tripartite tricarboxylate transporter TctB family protein [Xanthobacteraceae bacterium]